ncbi:hypothetical protein ACFZDP_30720 [Streptomyces mirabilis]|uniref:hypothetical protein n=1 Tax=Streptomyces mirabilis TaxID=68239 RepID=UPI0036F0C977
MVKAPFPEAHASAIHESDIADFAVPAAIGATRRWSTLSLFPPLVYTVRFGRGHAEPALKTARAVFTR